MSDKSPRTEHVQEVRQVHQGEARREARDGGRESDHDRACTTPRRSDRAPLSLGVIGSSAKENEHRLPLHPEHLARILEPSSRQRITLEHGYGARFGTPTASSPLVAGFASREEILRRLRRRGAAQAAARGRRGHGTPGRSSGAGRTACRTRVDDPARHRPRADPDRLRGDEPLDGRTARVGLHVFHKNNELAGYCSVLQALELAGIHRRLRAPAQRGRDRVRRHGPRRGHRPERARRPRGRGAHQPRGRRGGVPDPLGADPAVRPRPRASAPSAT